jgi:hypothetical protein
MKMKIEFQISRKAHTNSLSIFELENRNSYFYLLEWYDGKISKGKNVEKKNNTNVDE